METNYLMDQMLGIVKQMKDKTDTREKVRALPAFKVALFLRGKLMDHGITKEHANRIVTSLEIKVTDSLFSDPAFADELLGTYAASLANIYNAYYIEFGHVGATNFCKGMSFEFSA